MDRKMMSLAVISAAALLAVTCVTASSWTLNTPLYAMRMEQASSKMNFLPTKVNTFSYTTEKGSTLNYGAAGYCDNEQSLASGDPCISIELSCIATYCETCPQTQCGSTCSTCEFTCPYGTHCPHTCHDTCVKTCSTCPNTCETCTGC